MVKFKSDLAVQLAKELKNDERTQESAIEVVDNNGVVTLTGTATSHEEREAAEKIAAEHKGVISVINDVELEEEPTLGVPLVSPRQTGMIS